MAEAQPQPERAFCAPSGKTLHVVPRFPKQKGGTHVSAYGVAWGQRVTAGRPEKPRSLRSGSWGGRMPFTSQSWKADFRLPLLRAGRQTPDQMLLENYLRNDPMTRQSETRPRRGLTFPSPLHRGAACLTQRPPRWPAEQCRPSSGPQCHTVTICEKVGVTEASDCKPTKTPLRCH